MKTIKNVCLLLVLALAALAFVGCKKVETEFTIGIIQIESHAALDAARDGFVEELGRAGLKDGENIKIIYANPEGKPDDLTAMSTNLVRQCDLVLAIATPTAVAVKTAAISEGRNIPILFTAVTDPVKSLLVTTNENPGGRVTGTSDMNPVNEQIELVKEMLPSIQKLGIIYTISEENSKIQSDMAEAKAEANGLTVEVQTVTGISDISASVNGLLSKGVEAIYIPTDNNLAKNISIVTQLTNVAKVPVICGEEGQVTNGGTITLSISYKKLGEQTGKMAAAILLEGANPATMSVQSQGLEDCVLVVNENALTTIELTLPQSIRDRMESND